MKQNNVWCWSIGLAVCALAPDLLRLGTHVEIEDSDLIYFVLFLHQQKAVLGAGELLLKCPYYG